MANDASLFQFVIWTLVWQPIVLLAIGLACSLLLRRWAARTHAVLLFAVILSFVAPALTIAVHASGGGLLQPHIVADTGETKPAALLRRAPTPSPSLPGSPIPTDPSQDHAIQPPASLDEARATDSPIAATTTTPTAREASTSSPPSLQSLLVVGWALAATFLLLLMAISIGRSFRILARAHPVEHIGIHRLLRLAAANLGVRRSPLALQSRDVRSPAIWCWAIRPTLLLPSTPIAGGLDWIGVFCHELAHWKRRDHFSAILADLLACLLPWNPLIWLARNRMAFAAERACDDTVLAAGCSAATYADTLLQLAPSHRPALALGAVSRTTNIAHRIRAILSERPIRATAGRTWLVLSIAISVMAAIGAALAQPAAARRTVERETVQNNPDTPWWQGRPSGAASNEIKRPPNDDTRTYAERLAALKDKSWREASALGDELADLPGDDGFTILQQAWSTLPAEAKQQMLKSWHYTGPYPLHARMHPRLLDVLDLGMNDAAPSVQTWSIGYLKEVAFRDFSEDFSAYRSWYNANRARPLLNVMRDGCNTYITSLVVGSREQRRELAKLETNWVFRDVPSLRKLAIDNGLLDAIGQWMQDPALDQDVDRRIGRLLPQLDPPQDYLQKIVLPAATNGPTEGIRSAALSALGKPTNAWAVDPLSQSLVAATLGDDSDRSPRIWTLAQTLADIDDARPVPTMIGLIAADNTYDTVYGIGYFGLGRLTGVAYDKQHDAAWWTHWWETNKSRYPHAVQTTAIPTFPRTGRQDTNASQQRGALQGGEEPSDVDDVPAEDIKLDTDGRQRYFLIGPKKGVAGPKAGYRLLLVLPGGDGSADFHPFVKRIFKNALPANYIVAQPVAPQWSSDENRIVWPTQRSREPKAKFTTEAFLHAIIKDVSSRHTVDPKHVMALGWSSSGPAVYAMAMAKDSPLCGAFVAMSVYKPAELPATANAKGRAFYILHSPSDFIKMSFPENARKTLSAAGAKVKLQTYDGGHGWHGDVFAQIRAGVKWLEEARPAASAPAKGPR